MPTGLRVEDGLEQSAAVARARNAEKGNAVDARGTDVLARVQFPMFTHHCMHVGADVQVLSCVVFAGTNVGLSLLCTIQDMQSLQGRAYVSGFQVTL